MPIDLGEVDGRVLQLMASNSDTSFSFQGMKRSLQIHQEKLSRSLNRLTTQGLVGKKDDGYLITKKGVKIAGCSNPAPRLVVGSSYLPNDVDPAAVFGMLKGKWFSGMRWLGSSPNALGMDLKWVTDDGEVQVQVSFSNNNFEVSLLSFSPNEEDRAREIATRLFVKIVNTLYQRKIGQEN